MREPLARECWGTKKFGDGRFFEYRGIDQISEHIKEKKS